MFSHLIGNEEVKERLLRLLSNSRLPNSLIFGGPDGVGKRLFAVEAARSFVCHETNGAGACGHCTACRRVGDFYTAATEKGEDFDKVFFSEHPDVGLVIPYKRNLRVGAIRDLEIQANFRPFEARARVFIVDEADKMNDAAANALLKTLEEPAETSFIILITSRPDSLLQTIRSRCQMIRFAPVSSTAIATMLREKGNLSSDDAHLIAKVSRGSIGKAAAIDLMVYRAEREKQLAVVNAAFVEADRSRLIKASEGLNDAANKDRFEENLEILELLLHDLWLIKNGGARDAICNFDIYDHLLHVAQLVKTTSFTDFLSCIESLRRALGVNINRKMATDALFMKMTA